MYSILCERFYNRAEKSVNVFADRQTNRRTKESVPRGLRGLKNGCNKESFQIRVIGSILATWRPSKQVRNEHCNWNSDNINIIIINITRVSITDWSIIRKFVMIVLFFVKGSWGLEAEISFVKINSAESDHDTGKKSEFNNFCVKSENKSWNRLLLKNKKWHKVKTTIFLVLQKLVHLLSFPVISFLLSKCTCLWFN